MTQRSRRSSRIPRLKVAAAIRAIGFALLLLSPSLVQRLPVALAQPSPATTGPADQPAAEKGKKPVISVTPDDLLLPASVTVTGSGFTDAGKATITLSPGGSKLGTIKPDKKGRFSKSVKLPEVATGTYTITAKAGKKKASAKIAIGNPPGGPVALGAFTSGLPADLGPLDSFERAIGRPARIVMWYQAWAGGNENLNVSYLNTIVNRGAMPMITWEPFNPAGGIVQPDFQLADLCSTPGSLTPSIYDAYIDDWATKLAAWGRPVLLRFAQEMNGNWYSWSEQTNGNQPGDYVAAWNCLRARFLAKGAINVQWVWSPNVNYVGATPYAQVFPGDGAVNWIAIDGYNWGTVRPEQGWKSFAQLFGASILTADAMSARPIMIGETSSVEQGGNKAAWITDAMLRQIPLNYPQVRALIWFNVDKEADWRIGSSAASRDAFVAAANEPYWRATLPAAAQGWPPGAAMVANPARNERHGRRGASD